MTELFESERMQLLKERAERVQASLWKQLKPCLGSEGSRVEQILADTKIRGLITEELKEVKAIFDLHKIVIIAGPSLKQHSGWQPMVYRIFQAGVLVAEILI